MVQMYEVNFGLFSHRALSLGVSILVQTRRPGAIRGVLCRCGLYGICRWRRWWLEPVKPVEG